MEFLKALAREADRQNRSTSELDAKIHTPSPPSCALSTPLAALHAAVVMEMLTDELDVLSCVVSADSLELRTAGSIELDKQEHRPKFSLLPKKRGEQRHLSLVQQYATVIPRRMMQGLGETSFWFPQNIKELLAEAKIKTDSPGGKYQMDRTFVQMVADNALRELVQTGTFTSLYQTVMAEQAVLRKFWTKCVKLAYDRAKISRLKGEVSEMRQASRARTEELDAEIFKLMDQSLELDKRIHLESRLVEKQVNMVVKRFKRTHRQIVSTHNAIIQKAQHKLKVENRVHYEIVQYLKQEIGLRTDLLNYWTEKYDVDLTRLTTALEEMIAERSKDLKRARYLEAMIKRWKPIVMEDKRLRALQAERERWKERAVRCAIKIEAWWRGTMVRNHLGPYRPVLGSKDKKKGGDAGAKDAKGAKKKK